MLSGSFELELYKYWVAPPDTQIACGVPMPVICGLNVPSPSGSAAATRFRRRTARRQTTARRHSGTGPERDVLGLSSEHHLVAAVGVELHDLVGSGVDNPHVVLRIDAHLLGEVDGINTLADFLH